ncbi:MAG: cation-transporting ATPase 4 [Piptocephalis tieghemiana]|nr:MAG: cation-transporting ATPase 4 [Piptocephalis tieghemiana]
MTQRLVESKSLQEASLHKELPTRLHAYGLPFALIYLTWAYIHLTAYDTYIGSRENNTLILGLIATTHLLSFLVCKWSVKARTTLTCLSAPNPQSADLIRLIPRPGLGKGVLCPILHASPDPSSPSTTHAEITFLLHQKKYIWDQDKKIFKKLQQPGDRPIPMSLLHASKGLLSTEAIAQAKTEYGPNRFEIPFPTFRELFEEHAVAPFFVFQLFCVALWCLDEYWYYSIFTLVMLVVFESTVVMQRIKTLTEFRTLSLKPFPIRTYRAGTWIEVSSEDLLPGDICSVVRSKGEMAIPCDMILLDGGCIANEAMLSGESTPQSKESVRLRPEEDLFDLADSGDRLHVLFGGTKVLQVTPSSDAPLKAPDGGCIALVVRTGFGTAQGKLVRTMVYNTEHVSANNTEALMFILFLLIFAIAAASYVWIEGNRRHGDRRRGKLMLDCVMILTSVVPPELPMELSLAVNTSLVALAKHAIFCTEPFRIPFAGKVDVCCFDKTGTLTGEDLVVEGVAGLSLDRVKGKSGVQAEDPGPFTLSQANLTPKETILVLATAHGLVRLEEEEDEGEKEHSSSSSQRDGTKAKTEKSTKGEKVAVVGDPMEKAALDAIGWEVQLGGKISPRKESLPSSSSSSPSLMAHWKGPSAVRILRRFPFSSALKRMSTLGHFEGHGGQEGKWWVGVKGAPETLKSMYLPESIPVSYDAVYKHYGKHGSRVLALGWKWLPMAHEGKQRAVEEVVREEVEGDLHFAGFLIFHCPLKEDTKEAISMLNESSHRVIMITGDNPLTACHVANQVDIVNKPIWILDGPGESGAEGDEMVLTWRGIGGKEDTSSEDGDEGPIQGLTLKELTDPNGPMATWMRASGAGKLKEAGIFSEERDLCLTGSAMEVIEGLIHPTTTSTTAAISSSSSSSLPSSSISPGTLLRFLVSRIWVYARVSPRQKEVILTELKAAGYTTLMCGDGTNDVGALKQAHVGVALLDGRPEDLAKIAEHARIQRLRTIYEKQRDILQRWDRPVPPPPAAIAHLYPSSSSSSAVTTSSTTAPTTREQRQRQQQEQVTQQLMQGLGALEGGLGEEDEVPVIKLGDASVAAPFTSKLSSVMSICNIVRQGRCTLVATIQMYKILALNCLISAFSLSVLYLDGIKYGDFQMTVSGLLLAVCFMCISKATPLEKLSKQRPQSRIFCPYILISILGQFAVHIGALVTVVSQANRFAPPDEHAEVDVDGDFEPSLLNTSVYLISLAMQVSTFAINYQGHPFRESLQENKVLYNGLCIVGGIALAGATELFPDLNAYMQLVPFPKGFSTIMTLAVILDLLGAYVVEAIAYQLFADDQPKDIVRIPVSRISLPTNFG